jgi:peptidoglycan hydrolase-like protein with peptidoglycan-binding domain
MKKKFKKIISIIMVAAVIASVVVVGTVSSSASGTGVGLAEWALNAYYSNWSYVYGGSTPGAVDCSGLIYSYAGGYRVGDAQTFNSDYRGSMSGGIPNIHGLGLYQPGHVGVYVGNGMAVDARGDDYGVCYESVWSHGWTQYFKVPGVSYPDTGWVEFDGDYYYYEDGEYLADTTRTIDGETYVFASSGKSTSSPSSASSSESSSSLSSSSDNETKSSSLKKGSTGSEVEKMQQRLYDLGYYTGAVDGEFGDSTEEAFKRFQEAAGLYVDGVAGSDLEVLYADDAPAYKAEEKEEETTSEQEDLADTGAQADIQPADITTEQALVSLFFSNGDYSDDVAKIQNRLITLGYLDGAADGEYGTSTETAVMGFQSNNDLAVTGVVEQNTYDKLFSDSAVAAPKAEVQEAEKPAADAEVQPQANLPKTANENKAATGSINTPKTNNAPDTKVEKDTTEISSKGLEAVAASSPFKRGTNGTNFEFLIWLAIMIVVMLITFTIVYVIEKKKQKATRGRRFQ